MRGESRNGRACRVEQLERRRLLSASLADWVGTNNTAAPNSYTVTTPTAAGGTFQSRVSATSSLRDDTLASAPFGRETSFAMGGTVTFDAPAGIVDPTWFFGFYGAANVNHRVGLGTANPTAGDNLRWQIQATNTAGSGQSIVNLASSGATNVPDGTYPFSLAYNGTTHVVTASVGPFTGTFTYAYTGAADLNRFGFLQPATSANAATFTLSVNDITYTGETPVATTPPAAPTNLSAQGSATAGQINLAWADDANNESGFTIERRTGSGGWATVATTVAANATSYADTGLLPSTTYTYRVRATNGAGASGWSNEFSAMTRANASISATNYSRTQIYPVAGLGTNTTTNWNSWLGTWQMADGSLMISFTEAKGPVQPHHVNNDYSGLDVDVVYLRSVNAGASWTKVIDSDVSFTTSDTSGKGTHANNGPTTLVLKDGSLIRRVYGWDYAAFPSMPGTTFLQRSTDGGLTWSAAPTSSDGGNTWSDPDPKIQEFLLDPANTTIQMTRTRRLRDGRILMAGNVWNGRNTQSAPREPLLMISADEAASWQRVPMTGADWTRFNEWDFTELDNGDLFIVSRINTNNNPRWQGVMRKDGSRWTYQPLTASVIPHSGHPELLKTREGPVLHIATTGTRWTSGTGVSPGQTWNPLRVDSLADRAEGDYTSRYYPHSLQTADGWVYVFGHSGWDNYYGEVDQAVFMDKFRLTATTATTASAAPGTPDLLAASDTGASNTDNLTNRDNSAAGKQLQFSVSGTIAGATVTIFADGVAVGGAIATGTTTTVTTLADFDLADGAHVVTARQIEPGRNESAASGALNVTVDTTPPVVTGVFVAGTAWTSGYLSSLQATGEGEAAFGYAVKAAEQTRTLAWSNLDKVSIRFSQHVNVAATDLVMNGVNVAAYALVATTTPFTYDAATFTATWTLSRAIANDKVTFRLDGLTSAAAADAAGNLLDGEWTNPVHPSFSADAFPSGDGSPGGNFEFNIRVLPGDVNRDGAVNVYDYNVLRANLNLFGEGVAGGDLDGDDLVSVVDFNVYRAYLNKTAPA